MLISLPGVPKRTPFFIPGPPLRWMADNLYVSTDAAGNIKPNKQKATDRIDGVVALIMALDRAIRNEGALPDSVYDTRSLLVYGEDGWV